MSSKSPNTAPQPTEKIKSSDRLKQSKIARALAATALVGALAGGAFAASQNDAVRESLRNDGTSQTSTPEQAVSMHNSMRDIAKNLPALADAAVDGYLPRDMELSGRIKEGADGNVLDLDISRRDIDFDGSAVGQARYDVDFALPDSITSTYDAIQYIASAKEPTVVGLEGEHVSTLSDSSTTPSIYTFRESPEGDIVYSHHPRYDDYGQSRLASDATDYLAEAAELIADMQQSVASR